MHRNYCPEGEEVLHAEQSFHMQHNYEFFGFCVLFRLQKISVLSLHNLAVMTKSCSASTFNVGYRVLVRPCFFFFFHQIIQVFKTLMWCLRDSLSYVVWVFLIYLWVKKFVKICVMLFKMCSFVFETICQTGP